MRPSPPPVARHAAGFTLLEAIVAMVILATSLVALYGWLSTNMISLRRAEARHAQLVDARSALALVDGINPMAEPEGERSLPPLTVRWSSRPLTPATTGLNGMGSITLFDFVLYGMQVTVAREGAAPQTFDVRKAGWVASRSSRLEE